VRQLLEQDAVTALARQLALQSELIERVPGSTDATPQIWTLRVENAALAQSAAGADSPTRERLQAALAQAGHAVRLRVVAGPVADSPASRQAIAADARMKAAQVLLKADPFVQELLRDFAGAKIVPGSVKPL
jgi:DNA polymerase-3 subunit gamma/tau